MVHSFLKCLFSFSSRIDAAYCVYNVRIMDTLTLGDWNGAFDLDFYETKKMHDVLFFLYYIQYTYKRCDDLTF